MWSTKHLVISSKYRLPLAARHHHFSLLRRCYQTTNSSSSTASRTNTLPSSPTPPPPAPVSNSSSSPTTSSINSPLSKPIMAPVPPQQPPAQDIRLWKHYLAPSLFALVTIAGSFLMAASNYEREESLLYRQRQQRRELLQRKLRANVSVDEDTFKADEWRREHDSLHRRHERQPLTDEQQRQQTERLAKQQQRREEENKHFFSIERTLGMIKSWTKYQLYQIDLYYQDHMPSASQHTIGSLIGLNLLVFAGWRLLPLKCQPFMTRWFTNHAAWSTGPRNITLITANFSHQHVLPLAINMVALWYVGTRLHDILGRQQFSAFYISSAVAATTSSRILGLLTRRYRPLLLLPSSTSTGASGTVYACLAALTALHPKDTIDIVPRLSIPFSVALPSLLTLDVTGILFRWALFDHYAHLGGSGFGLCYMTYGQEKMWIPLVRKIREIRDRNQRNGRNGSGPPATPIELPTPYLRWFRRVNKE